MKTYILILSFLFSSLASAENYYWVVNKTGASSPSPQTACESLLDNTWDVVSASINGDTGICNLSQSWSTGSKSEDVVVRRGDSCVSGTQYNAAKGTCDKPPSDCKVGDLFPAKGSVSSVITSNGKNYVASKVSESSCYSGCKYTAVSDARPSSCYVSKTDKTQGWCNYVMTATGDGCNDPDATLSETGSALNPSDTPNVPSSNPNDPLCPSGWSNSNGTCFKDPSTPDTGTGGTGGSGGGTGGSGGGTGGSGGTGGGSGGAGGSDHSSGAAGDLDNSTKGGTKTEGEECKPRADGSGCDGPVVNGEDCDAVLQCSGDAIQCAILRKQKRLVCDMQYDSNARNFVETQVSKDDYKLKTSDIDGSQLFTSGVNASRWLPASCPAPKSISVMGHSETFTFDPACRAATALGPILVALAGIFFAVYVGRAFGGN